MVISRIKHHADYDSILIKGQEDESLITVSTSPNEKRWHLRCFSLLNDKRVIMKKGLNFITRDDQKKYETERFETLKGDDSSAKVTQQLEDLIRDKKRWILVGNRARINDSTKYKEKLKNLGFTKLQNINKNTAYIAYTNKEGKIIEHSSKSRLTYILPEL